MTITSPEHVGTIISLINPSPRELSELAREHGIHPLIVDDLTRHPKDPSCEAIGPHRYLSLWDLTGDDEQPEQSDLAIIFNKQVAIFVQRGTRSTVRDIDLVLAGDSLVPVASTLSAVYRVLASVVNDFIAIGATIQDELSEAEDEVFDSAMHEDYRRIYRLRRRIGQIDRAASGLARALSAAEDSGHPIAESEPGLRAYFDHLADSAQGLARLATAAHGDLDAVVSAHESNVASRQNEDMRTISVYAALLAIPTVMAGIYGMNFANMPLLKHPWGWLLVLALSLALDVGAYVIFRRRGWLGGKSATRRVGERADQS